MVNKWNEREALPTVVDITQCLSLPMDLERLFIE